MCADRLGEVLVRQGTLTREQLSHALKLQHDLGGRVGTNLLELGVISEDALLAALGRHRATVTASGADLHKIPPEIVKMIPPKLALRYGIVPFKLQDQTLYVASSEQGDSLIEDEIKLLTGCMVRSCVGLEVWISDALERYYHGPNEVRLSALAKRLINVARAAATSAAQPAAAGPTSAPRSSARRRAAQARQQVATPEPEPEPPRFVELDDEDSALLEEWEGTADELKPSDVDTQQIFPWLRKAALEAGEAPTRDVRAVREQLRPQSDAATQPEDTSTRDLRAVREQLRAQSGAAAAPAATEATAATAPAVQPPPPSQPPAEAPEAREAPEAPARQPLDDPDLSVEWRLYLAARELQHAEIRDDIADVLLDFSAPYFRRRLLLIRRRQRIVGWRGGGDGVLPETVRAIEVDIDEPSVFVSVTAGSFWLGPLPSLPANQNLVLGLGGTAPLGCVVLPVALRSKVVCYLYGDNLDQGVAGLPMAELRRLVAKASIAFEVYILKNKMRLL